MFELFVGERAEGSCAVGIPSAAVGIPKAPTRRPAGHNPIDLRSLLLGRPFSSTGDGVGFCVDALQKEHLARAGRLRQKGGAAADQYCDQAFHPPHEYHHQIGAGFGIPERLPSVIPNIGYAPMTDFRQPVL